MIGVFDFEVVGQHICQPANLAPAHRVGLPGDRERPHAGTADASRREVAVDDRVDLVGAAAGLVDPLRIDRDRFFGAGPEGVELGELIGGKAGRGGIGGAGSSEGRVESGNVLG